VGGVSSSNSRSPAESCSGTGIDPETGTEIGRPGDGVIVGVYASVANTVIGA
jgi:hypothetical protein